MANARQRLDRFISASSQIPRGDVRKLVAARRITVDGDFACDAGLLVDYFSHITLDSKTLQRNMRRYYLLHKPAGVVSATTDEAHTTVIDLLRASGASDSTVKDLHIAGRLDRSSTGLLLLTNDGEWSKKMTAPDKNIFKVYQVTVEKPINDNYIKAFRDGMFFPYEGITTKPAQLEIIDAYSARVTLMEGKYHQIKRMFGRFRNPVLKLHRIRIGNIELDSTLESGQFRELTQNEVRLTNSC
ncbi:16S rRNA pseudouridine(516) synthase [Thalassolituus sp.]|uniref:pseudouridine synthase n=1 Tax=Thalassolituus sp. TaxID=2030822 RepID=UPI0027D54902|nr:16S rRNA pseudouridine(516) synthase [Thalassolituus sp.]MDQ4426163.1 16S rRNA pseudouridine(516) synthase [Thalassolituus sp.]